MSKIKLLILDLDGTCNVMGGAPHPGTFETIKKAHDEYGTKVVFATGRTHYAPLNGFEKLGDIKGGKYHVASFNGANIRDLTTDTKLDQKPISSELTEWLWKYIEKENRFSAMSYSENSYDVIYSKNNERFVAENPNLHPSAKMILSTDVKKYPGSYKFLFFGFTEKDKKNLEDKRFHVQWEPSPSGGAEINAHGINKGYVVDYFCSKYNIDHSEVLAMGDGANDVESLKKAGYGICPANAGAAAKKAAKQISKYTDAEGCVSKTIEELVFNK